MSESDAHIGGGSDAGSGGAPDGGAAKKPWWKISRGQKPAGGSPANGSGNPADPSANPGTSGYPDHGPRANPGTSGYPEKRSRAESATPSGIDPTSGYPSDSSLAPTPAPHPDGQEPPDDPTPSTFATHRSDFITAALVVAAIGLLLTFVGWMRPTAIEKAEQTKSTHTMTFDYTANVPPSPAYQTTEVRAPDPRTPDIVFVRLGWFVV